MRRHICLAFIAILLPLPASAEVILRSKCSLNPGKTFASVEAVFVDWRKLFEEEGFGDYRVRLLIPHAAPEARAGVFWIEGSSPNFERYGKAWPLDPSTDGVFRGALTEIGAGALYRYRVDGSLYPDPASRSQPDGVHGPSMVIDPSSYAWSDTGWHGVPLEDLIIYELHVGTFTPEGTFAAAEARLPHLLDLGVTAIELMPVADFPGNRNWGYDTRFNDAAQLPPLSPRFVYLSQTLFVREYEL